MAHDVNIFIFSSQFIAMIRIHGYSRKGIKNLYPNSDIQGQMNHKSGSCDLISKADMKPDFHETRYS